MKIPLTFEEMAPYFKIDGKASLHEGPAPMPWPDVTPEPDNIIRIDQKWRVNFKWETTGVLNYLVQGTWHLKVILEEMGPGEFTLLNNTKEVSFVAEPHTYQALIEFEPNSVPPGIYRPVCVLTFTGPAPHNIPGPIAAFGEGDMIQFYKVGP